MLPVFYCLMKQAGASFPTPRKNKKGTFQCLYDEDKSKSDVFSQLRFVFVFTQHSQ